MLKLEHAKPLEQLLNAPPAANHVMTDAVDYMKFASELRSDIADRYPYPSLWAAIDRLIEFEKKHIKAEIQMYESGYTYDDAFTLSDYYKNGAPND